MEGQTISSLLLKLTSRIICDKERSSIHAKLQRGLSPQIRPSKKQADSNKLTRFPILNTRSIMMTLKMATYHNNSCVHLVNYFNGLSSTSACKEHKSIRARPLSLSLSLLFLSMWRKQENIWLIHS